jgi:hypothetical protein
MLSLGLQSLFNLKLSADENIEPIKKKNLLHRLLGMHAGNRIEDSVAEYD